MRVEPIHTVCATKIKFPACLGSDEQVGDTTRCSTRRTAEAIRGLLAVVRHLGTGATEPQLGLRATGLFDSSTEDVEHVMAADPAVQAGILSYEIHPTWSFPGSTHPAVT